MVIKKSTLLGFINLILFCWFAYMLACSHYPPFKFISLYVGFKEYASQLIIGGLALLSAYLVYTLLIKTPKKLSLPVMMILTFASLFWLIFTFIGFFFVSHPAFPLLTLLIAATFYGYARRYSHKIALFLSFGTILIMSLVMLSSFEEDYCWKQGILIDPAGGKYVKATKADADNLKDYGVSKGEEIGIAFKTHMLCHDTFSFTDAIRKSYFHY